MSEESRGVFTRDHPLRTRAWGNDTVRRLYFMALGFACLLLLQSLILLTYQNDDQLKFTLLMQTVALTVFAFFSRGAAGTYLNAPLVFAASIFLWHSPFLLGHYFQLAPIFEFTARAFNIGFEFIYKATALVSLSLALTLIGMMRGYRRQLTEAKTNRTRGSLTRACYSSLGPAAKRIAWYLFAGLVCILVLYTALEGKSVFGGKYLDLYATERSSLIDLLFDRSELFWAFVIILLIACYKDVARVRILVVVAAIGVSVLFAMFGARTFPFMSLTALLLSWDCFVQRVRLRWIAAFVLFLSAASYVMEAGRIVGLGTSVFNFGETGKERVELLGMVHEQGRSFTIVLRAMELRKQHGLMKGRTLLDAAISVIPLPILKVTGYMPAETLPDRVVDMSPDIPLFEGMGSSLVAEFYDNFGMLGCLGFLFMGWFISRVYFKFVILGDVFAGVNVMTVAAMYTVMMRNHPAMYTRILIYVFVMVALLKHKREESFLSPPRSKKKNFLPNLPGQTAANLVGPEPSDGPA